MVTPALSGSRIEADVSIVTESRTERRLVEFDLDPSQSKDVELIVLPAEIAKGFGGQDPTEWKWQMAARPGLPGRERRGKMNGSEG